MKYLRIALAILAALMIIQIVIQDKKINQLTEERDKYKTNTEVLLSDVEEYKVRDSLSAARVGSLELTIKEFEQLRAGDAALINELKGKNRDLERLSKAQAQTIIDLSNTPKDTVILVDSIPVKAKKIHAGDRWYDFEGLLTENKFEGSLSVRDSLVIAETVRYKKFLFWKTKKIKDRRVDCISLNPQTTILGIEHIIIDQ
jgi:hypothetical protein